MRPATSLALVALAFSLSLGSSALAQDQVHVFDEAPSLDELRAVLIPYQGPGLSRKIEIPPRDAMTPAQAAPVAAPALAVAPAAPPQPASLPPAKPGPIPAATTTTTGTPRQSAMKQAAVPMPARQGNAVAYRINFALASDAIPAAYHPHLDRIVELMKQEPTLALIIEGHTDAYGGDAYNLELSRRRAISVMRYLVAHGIDGSRLVAVGKGKSDPLLQNPFDPRNRRVQFVSTGQSGT